MRVVEQVPGCLIHRGVDGGQQHAAVRQAGDDAEQTGDGRDAGGGAGDQHILPGRGVFPGGGLGVQQCHLARCRVHQAVLGEVVRPSAGDDVKEFQRSRPVRGVGGVGSVGQAGREVDFCALRLVHQQGEFPGQQPRPVGGARCAVSTVPGQDQPGERGEALRGLDCGRQVKGAGERHRRLVQCAQCSDAREQQRCAARGAEKGLGQGTGCAARGQQDEALRAFKGIGRALQPVGRNGVEERDVRREGEEVHRESPVSLACSMDSASAKSDGVDR